MTTSAPTREGAIDVRRISADDWRVWREVRLESLREAPEAFAQSVATATMRQDTEEWWRGRLNAAEAAFIAYAEDDAVGIVAVDPAQAGGFELVSMYVSARARRRGVGAALIQAVIDTVAGHALRLRIKDGNQAARQVYERAGFVDDGCEVDGDDCLSMTWRDRD